MRWVLPIPIILTACATAPAPTPKLDCSAPGPRAEGASIEDAARGHVAACGLAQTSSLTSTLVTFPTVRAREGKTGPSFVAMRRYLEKWSKRHGFTFENFDDDPWVVSWGEGDPSVAFVMHADVVPVVEDVKADRPKVPSGWSTPPFEVIERQGRLYGRGTEDDKGPIAAVLNTMATLKSLGYQPRGKVQAILGTGEEHDWDGMVAYAKKAPHAKFVVSIDANFPVVVAESGFVRWLLTAPRGAGGDDCAEVTEAKAGQFLTQVPGEALLKLSNPSGLDMAAQSISDRANVNTEIEGTTLTVYGRAVHSSVADEGDNALWALARAAGKLNLCDGGVKQLLATVAKYFDGDHWGERLGVAYDHETMGRLLVVPTMLRVDEDTVTLSINMRRPAGRDVEAFNAMLDTALEKIRAEVSTEINENRERRYVGEPALADTKGPLVNILLDIYRKAFGDPNAKPLSIRGGTYARLFPGAVSFGPSIPGREYRGHAPDEYLESEALQLMNVTLLEALLRLDSEFGRTNPDE
ncbi:MAG: Sapep family Mn(2+)-dependent dipeptidase [Deltaproteobacteria bacterium]